MGSIIFDKTSNFPKLFKERFISKATTIMVVEDDENTRDLIFFALKKKGYNVLPFDNALSALEALKSEKVDIIISDVMMPKMNGIEFCSRVKSKLKQIYFIIITAKDDVDDKVEGLNTGADEYITKPFDFKEFMARIQAAERIVKNQKELVHLNEKLEKIAETDELTNLHNRRYFMIQAQNELERAKRYSHTTAILIIDLDKFKEINDKYGHFAGDEALKKSASIILGSTRVSDVVCRFGGDEFIAFLPETNPKSAFRVAEKIRKNIERADFKIADDPVPLRVSIGISVKVPHMNINLKNLVDKADKALYKSKNDGGNKTTISKWFNINDLKI